MGQESPVTFHFSKLITLCRQIGLAAFTVVLTATLALAQPALRKATLPSRRSASAAPVVVKFPNPNVFLSPYNWRLPGDGTVWAPDPFGPYFKFSVKGTSSIIANMDTTIYSSLNVGQYPWFKVILNNGAPRFIQLTAGQSQVTLASGLSAGRVYTVKVYTIADSADTMVDMWSSTAGQLHIQSLQFGARATLSAYPTVYPKKCLIIGDSYLESYNGTPLTAPNYYTSVDPSMSWANQIGPALGCETGVVAVGGSGFLRAGGWGIPNLASYWTKCDSTHLRSLSPEPDYTINALGINDHRMWYSPSDVQNAVNNWLKIVRSALPDTKIFLYIPVGGMAGDEDGSGGANATPIREAWKAFGDGNTFLIDAGTTMVKDDNWERPTKFSPGDGKHPSWESQAKLSEIAVDAIQKAVPQTRAGAKPQGN